MSDFTSNFWPIFIIAISLGGIFGCVGRIGEKRNRNRKGEGRGEGGEEERQEGKQRERGVGWVSGWL